MIFRVRSKGTNNDDWHVDEIEAKDKKEAQQLVDEFFGIEYDKSGNQTNLNMIVIEFIED